MVTNAQVFLDANALIYALDETSEHYDGAVKLIQLLLDGGSTLCTSHHVVEEVVHVARKLNGASATEVVNEISKIPDLVLIEPDAVLAFAERYAALSDKFRMGVNDALLLQLMIDAGIENLLSYDKQFISKATQLGITPIT